MAWDASEALSSRMATAVLDDLANVRLPLSRSRGQPPVVIREVCSQHSCIGIELAGIVDTVEIETCATVPVIAMVEHRVDDEGELRELQFVD